MPGKLLTEWLQNPELLEPPQLTMPHLAVKGGVTLLSGREKVGKSTLVGGAVAAASRGQPFLSEPVRQPLNTVWYSLDERVSDTVRRFHELGGDGSRIYINAEPRTVDEWMAALDDDLEEFPLPDLVVLDNLSRVLSASGINTNKAEIVEPEMMRIVDYFHELDIAAILLFHTNKAGHEYKGNVAIGASVDDVLTLRRRGRGEEDDFDDAESDDGRRLLVQDGRNLRGRVHLTCADGVYRLFEDASPPRNRILDTLRIHGAASSRNELARLSGVRRKDALREIGSLIEEGAIVESGRFLKPSAVTIREPLLAQPQSGGSQWFPNAGTTPEPIAEPVGHVGNATGSRTSHPTPRIAGTSEEVPEFPTRVDDRGVLQELRLTQHGRRWFDVEAA